MVLVLGCIAALCVTDQQLRDRLRARFESAEKCGKWTWPRFWIFALRQLRSDPWLRSVSRFSFFGHLFLACLCPRRIPVCLGLLIECRLGLSAPRAAPPFLPISALYACSLSLLFPSALAQPVMPRLSLHLEQPPLSAMAKQPSGLVPRGVAPPPAAAPTAATATAAPAAAPAAAPKRKRERKKADVRSLASSSAIPHASSMRYSVCERDCGCVGEAS